jgi:hypothetical protein
MRALSALPNTGPANQPGNRIAELPADRVRPSMDLAQELITAEIEGLAFPSGVGGEDNLNVYRANCGRGALSLHNERKRIDPVRRIAGRHK